MDHWSDPAWSFLWSSLHTSVHISFCFCRTIVNLLLPKKNAAISVHFRYIFPVLFHSLIIYRLKNSTILFLKVPRTVKKLHWLFYSASYTKPLPWSLNEKKQDGYMLGERKCYHPHFSDGERKHRKSQWFVPGLMIVYMGFSHSHKIWSTSMYLLNTTPFVYWIHFTSQPLSFEWSRCKY